MKVLLTERMGLINFEIETLKAEARRLQIRLVKERIRLAICDLIMMTKKSLPIVLGVVIFAVIAWGFIHLMDNTPIVDTSFSTGGEDCVCPWSSRD
jgi:hypothetical protein